ncbi:hypothetical protein CTI12_AA089580 [Artemisia annua]|uniref:Uncharacterized protein n=1 Tax=Artemisia annua TaxID=35608 RepID=A0A2U1Q0K9_ARTAN|nr:hypothetical protein CTI12_AA089580 [Artemisia annua]
MKKGGAGKKEEKPDAIDEVEQLLKLTQDDLLLKLTVNTHHKSKPISNFQPSSSSSRLNSDLDRRFEALRSKPNIQNHDVKKEEVEDVDNLFARFAALKGGQTANNNDEKHNHGIDVFEEDDDDEEDEVAKIISWAVDAARLDPSPSSDIDQEDETDDDSDSDSDDDVKRKVLGKKVTPSKVIGKNKGLKK